MKSILRSVAANGRSLRLVSGRPSLPRLRGHQRRGKGETTIAWRKLAAAAVAAGLGLCACSAAPKLNLTVAKKKHIHEELPIPLDPYKIDWHACLVSVIPLPDKVDKAKGLYDKAKYIIDFPGTVKKLEFTNVYESPRDLYTALESFPAVALTIKDCLPSPSSIPTTYPAAGTYPSSPATTMPASPARTSPGPGPVPDPPPTTPSPPDTTCVLAPDNPTCTSSDPIIDLAVGNSGDTTSCTFTDDITWGDGTSATVGPFPGANNSDEVISDHTYTAPGTYTIQSDDMVDTGDCSAYPATLTFTYGQ